MHANRAALGLDAADLDGLTQGVRARHARARRRAGDPLAAARRGIPAFDNDLRVAIDRAGRVIRVAGSPRHDLSVASSKPKLDGERRATRPAGERRRERPVRVKSVPSGARRSTRFADRGFARLVLFGAAGSASSRAT